MQGVYHQAILGDLNTMAHGIARLSPNYCCDAMRFWSIGRTEAYFWHQTVLSVADPSHLPEHDGTEFGTLSLTKEAFRLLCLVMAPVSSKACCGQYSGHSGLFAQATCVNLRGTE